MSIKLVRLKFGNNGAHFGEVGIGLEETGERVRSDSLFSALINSYARLYGSEAVGELLSSFKDKGNPPIRLSSTFIYKQKDNQFTYYLPKPLKFPHNYPSDDLSFFKDYKKIKYLPLSIWQRWYQGDGFKDSDRLELENSNQATGELKTSGVFDYSKTHKIHKLPKVAIDRTTAASNFYHSAQVEFQSLEGSSGLYFLVEFAEDDQSLEQNLYAALHLLGEEGIGGERSSGAGRFEIDYWGELSTTWQQVMNYKEGKDYASLSLFWSAQIDEEFLDNSSYELIERGGWISSGFSGRQLRRKKILMFGEGSVFQKLPQGALADVTPDGFRQHKIYRSGITLTLPIRVQSTPS